MQNVEVDIVLGDPVFRTDGPVGPSQTKVWHGIKTKHQRAGSLRSNRSGIPRKEVIQPQLPLRLPCYDFTPIINPT